jgi:hypothetical protein
VLRERSDGGLRALFGRKVCLDDKRSGLVSRILAGRGALVECFYRDLVLTEHSGNRGKYSRLISHNQGDLEPALHV